MSAPDSQLATRRALRAIFLLQGRTFEGAQLKVIAEALDCSASTTLRTLEVMQDEGIVERIPGRETFWRLSPRTIQLARAVEQEFAQMQARTDELKHRFSRSID